MPWPSWTRGAERPRRAARRPLLPAAARPGAAALLVGCAVVALALGLRYAHQAGPGWLDAAVDFRVRARIGRHPGLLIPLTWLGDPLPFTTLTIALVLACLAARNWRGAVLVAAAVPAAAALTEFLLKPLTGRTMAGALSYPSGHATSVFALATACAILLVNPPRPLLAPAARLSLALAALLAAAAVSAAVVGLGFHYFTDTVGGAAVGIATVLLTALVLDMIGAPRRREAPGDPLAEENKSRPGVAPR